MADKEKYIIKIQGIRTVKVISADRIKVYLQDGREINWTVK